MVVLTLLIKLNDMKKITITRKIQINLYEKENRKEHFKNLYRWRNICVKAANMISTAHYIQGNIKELFYLEDGTKKKLMDIKKSDDGILNTSAQNTTYQLLSKHFKGEIPMGIMTALNSTIQKTYKQEAIDVKNGKKSLRSYKNNIPIPLPRQGIKNIEKTEDGNFILNIYNTNWKTFFGRDRSNNRGFFERSLMGEYKLCDSSIMIDDKNKKTFFLAVYQFEPNKIKKLKDNKKLLAKLSYVNPIEYTLGKKTYNIGTKEEFLYQRQQIQASLRRLQINLRYAKGGKGRKRKLKALERFKKKENNYVTTKMHTYSRMLVDKAIKNECSQIILVQQTKEEKMAKDNEETILRNWSYYKLKDFIEYKAKYVGIEVVVE